MNVFTAMEDVDLGFLVLQVKTNIIASLDLKDKVRYGEAMMLLSLLEKEMVRRGMDTDAYGPDFIGMATED